MPNNKTNKKQLFVPIQKSGENEKDLLFDGILSDDSIDRDDEVIDYKVLSKWADTPQRIPVLADHKNEVDSYIGQYTSKELISNGESNALKVKARLFKSNPKAKMISEMMKEGAVFGLSIGAIPKESEEIVTDDGKKVNRWTDAELLEGSIVVIPSNRSAYAVMAKKFKINKENQEDIKMDDKQKQKTLEKEETQEKPEQEKPQETETQEKETEKKKEMTEETDEDKEEKQIEDITEALDWLKENAPEEVTSLIVDAIRSSEGEETDEETDEEKKEDEDKEDEEKLTNAELQKRLSQLEKENKELKSKSTERKAVLKSIKEEMPTQKENDDEETKEVTFKSLVKKIQKQNK